MSSRQAVLRSSDPAHVRVDALLTLTAGSSVCLHVVPVSRVVAESGVFAMGVRVARLPRLAGFRTRAGADEVMVGRLQLRCFAAGVLAALFWHFALNIFALLQALGVLPIVVVASTKHGLRAGSMDAMVLGRAQKLGTEAKVRLETAPAGRPARDLGLRDSYTWAVITGGFRTSVVTPVELNRDVERQLRAFLDIAREEQRERSRMADSSQRARLLARK